MRTEAAVAVSAESERVRARIAGGAYVAIIVLGMTCMGFVASRRSVTGDAQATLSNLRAGEGLVRWALVGELAMYALVLLASVLFFGLLRGQHQTVALLALVFRAAEAFIGAGLAAASTAYPLWLLQHDPGGSDLASTVHALVPLGVAGVDVVLFFMGCGGVLFFVLFWTSRLVPRPLAGWGMFTYGTMIVLPVVSLVAPTLPEQAKMICYAPGGLFELLFGLWLLIRGTRRS